MKRIWDKSTMHNASVLESGTRVFTGKQEKRQWPPGLFTPNREQLTTKTFHKPPQRKTKKQLRSVKYFLDSTESEPLFFWSQQWTCTGGQRRMRERQTCRLKTNRDVKTTRGSSDCIPLSAAVLPTVWRRETERRSGARIELSGWLVGWFAGWVVGGRPCVTTN